MTTNLSAATKKIQSRLKDKGIKKTYAEIRDVLNLIPSINLESIKDEEIDMATEELKNVGGGLIKTREGNKEMDGGIELVKNASLEMGVSLNLSEITLIAQNLTIGSDDLITSLDEVKDAITSFIRHKVSINSQKIHAVMDEIREVAEDGFSKNNEELNQGFKNINQRLQEQNKDFKSTLQGTLSLFSIS